MESGREVFSGRVMAAVDFAAAAASLEAGVLPCSSGEGHVLRIAASIAGGVPVDLREAVSALDQANTVLVAHVVLQAAGFGRSLVRPGCGPQCQGER